MISQQQLEANRRNAQKSTGPRTLRGKAVSCLNALTHGIYADSEVLPDESRDRLNELAQAYVERWEPALLEECYLVDTLIRCDWRMRRLSHIEAGFWLHLRCQDSYHVHKDVYRPTPSLNGLAIERSRGEFNRMQRRMDATHRTYMETLATLQGMADAAAQALEAQEAEAAKAEAAEYKAQRQEIAGIIKLAKLVARGPAPLSQDAPCSVAWTELPVPALDVPAAPEAPESPEPAQIQSLTEPNGFVPSTPETPAAAPTAEPNSTPEFHAVEEAA